MKKVVLPHIGERNTKIVRLQKHENPIGSTRKVNGSTVNCHYGDAR